MNRRADREVRAFAPASIGNVSCGFDVLGMALNAPGDVVTARRVSTPGVFLVEIRGDGGRLPQDEDLNTASVAAKALVAASGPSVDRRYGVELILEKGIALASGLGSSAASAVAAVVAVDALFELHASRETLLAAAVAGEAVASGAVHADNVAPSLLGGCVLVRSNHPLDAVSLPVPEDLAAAMIHPHVELTTRESREALPKALPLSTAVAQWGDLGAFVAGLFQEDWDLLGRAGRDHVAEPVRGGLIPGFRETKAAALEAGAVVAGISGAGPSSFALCRGIDRAREVTDRMAEAFRAATGLDCDAFATPIDRQGARVL